jgi:hypothetical protein
MKKHGWSDSSRRNRRGRSRFKLVAWMKRSEIRGSRNAEKVFPDCASLHPGYGLLRIAEFPLRQTAAFNLGFITKN